MGHLNSFGLGPTLLARTFFVTCISLIGIATQIRAQTEKKPEPAACTQPADPKLSELFLANSPKDSCALKSTEQPENPVPPAPGSSQIVLTNHRLFGLLANYTTVETQDQFGTLSAATKFKLSVKTMTDPVTVSFLAGIALIGQARDSDPTYGQGFSGYDKRFATFYADTGIGTLMTTSVFPTLLHQDPRYFQLGQGGVRRRMIHAISSIFVAHADNGALQFNYSQLVGNAVAAGISNAYHPQGQRTLGNTANVRGTDTLLNMLCNVAKEFWPAFRSKLHKQTNSSQP
ncbi:MAG: hypothetical protein WBE13_04210 [Candidatus Acidiferrum sp.]